MLIFHPPVDEGIKDEGYIDYFIESALYGFLFTRCKTLVLQRVNKNPYKAFSML